LKIFVQDLTVFKKKNFALNISRSEAMDCIPLRNPQVDEIRLETGEILLAYPASARSRFEKIILRLKGLDSTAVHLKKLQLDKLGTAVWELLNDKRSVRQIVRMFAQKYSLTPKEAEVSVSQFLRELGRRGLIGLR
jgi:hypothetical protein